MIGRDFQNLGRIICIMQIYTGGVENIGSFGIPKTELPSSLAVQIENIGISIADRKRSGRMDLRSFGENKQVWIFSFRWCCLECN